MHYIQVAISKYKKKNEKKIKNQGGMGWTEEGEREKLGQLQ